MTSIDIKLDVEKGFGAIEGYEDNWSNTRNATIAYGSEKRYLDIANEDDIAGPWISRGLLPVKTEGVSINITSGYLHIYFESCDYVITDDQLCIVETNQTNAESIALTDYGRFNETICGSINLSTNLVGAWQNISLNTTGLSWINNLSYTKLGLRALSDINATEGDTYIELNQNLTDSPPSLHLEYGGQSNISEFLSAIPTLYSALDPASIVNATFIITPTIAGEAYKYVNATFNISLSLTSILSQQYIVNATFNLSSDIYIQGTKEADTYIDDGGFWVFGKI